MRKTVQQLEAEAQETELAQRRRQEYVDRYTPDTAERVARAYHGSYYTNPEVTATLGLSDAPVDYKEVHVNSAIQAAKYKAQLQDRKALTANAAPEPTDDNRFTLVDLLRMDPQELAVRSDKAPAWWDKVDPVADNGMNWRMVNVPEITDAKQLLQLEQAQVVKLFLSKTKDEWFAIPGMIAKGTYDTKGNRVPGSFDPYADLGAKFPVLKDLWTASAALSDAPDTWSIENLSANLINTFQEGMQRSLAAAQIPFKAIGLMAPDHIGPAGGIQAGGLNIPTRIDVTKVGDVARAGVRTVATGLVAGAQFSKSQFEFAMTNRGALSSLGVQSLPVMDEETFAKYRQLVVEGNILSQIANQAMRGEKIDLGSGYFPEGKAGVDARAAHDAALPKIDGQTWTPGRATIYPLVQEGYIDRNGYVASLISGAVDGTFTLVTDITAYADPVRAFMGKYGITRKAATEILEGAAADRVYEAWAAERKAAGLSVIPRDIIDLPDIALRGEDYVPPKFAGMLPEGSPIPEEAQSVIDNMVNDALNNQQLSILDNPPPVRYTPPSDNLPAIKERFGVLNPDSDTPRFIPREIDSMPFTTDGQRTLNKLASFNNAGELWDHFLGDIPPGLAVALQDVVDAARAAGKEVSLTDLHKVFRDGVYSGDPLYNIRKIPGSVRKWVNQTGPAIAQWASGKTRQFATMPKSTFFTFDDPIASIADMNNLMVIMKVPKAARHNMLSLAMKAVAQGDVSRRFALADTWMETVIGPSLRKNGVPEEFIKNVTKWSGWSDDIQQWSFDAMGEGYPTSWFDDGTGEVLRSTDLMPKGFMMVAPENLRQVIRETTNLWKMFEPFRGNKAMERLLSGSITAQLEKFQSGYLKPFALGAPLPIRMVTRILPDELLRIAVSQSIDELGLKTLMAMGHVNYNTFGVEIKNANQIAKLVPQLEYLDDLRSQLKAATQIGDVQRMDTIQSLIDDFTAKYGTREEVKARIDLFNQRIDEALPGSGRKMAELAQGLMADERGLPAVQAYERQMPRAVQKYVTYTPDGRPIIDPKHPQNRNWVMGTARDLAQMSETPEYVEVAKALLAGGRTAAAELPQRFLTGDLKPIFEKIYDRMLRSQGAKGMSATMPLTTIEGQNAWIATIVSDIMTRTAGDPVAIGVVAGGKLGDASVLSKDAWKVRTLRSVNVYEPTQQLVDWVRENLLQNPNSAKVAPFAETRLVDIAEKKDRFLTKRFSWYRDASAFFARGPYHHYKKWQRIIELIPAMDPEEAAKMAAALDKTDIPEWMKARVNAEIPFATGTATRKQVDTLGEMFGAQSVDQLLYDSSKRSYFGSRHALLFGFFDAWKEQWSVWSRLMAQSPRNLERTRLLGEGLKNAELPEWAGGQPDRGILFTDEDTGEQAVAIPFSRQVYSLFGLNAEERIKTKNLSMLGSAVPGFFGVGAFIMDGIVPKNEAFQGYRNLVFPYGDPTTRAKIADYLLPAWAQGAGASLTSMAGGKFGGDLVDNLQALISSDINETVRATTLNAVLTNIASNREGIPLTVEQREQLLNDAVNKADFLTLIKSAGRIFLPGASMTKYFTEIGAENVTAGTVMDDLNKIVDDNQKAGGSYSDGVIAFLDKYGNDAWIYLAGATESRPGMQATKEYADWQRANPGLLDKYPLVAGYLGPQTGEFDPKAYSAQAAAGQRTPRQVEQRQEKALNNLAWSVYNNYKDQLIRLGASQGLTEAQVRRSTTFKDLTKAKADELKKQFSMWNPSASSGENERELVNQIQQINKMVLDPKVVNLPGGQGLKEYWDFRTSLVDIATKQNPSLANDSWRSAKIAAPLRAQLQTVGDALADKYPEFSTLWENVLSREFEPAEIGM